MAYINGSKILFSPSVNITNVDKNLFANALKGNASGESIMLNDVSPLTHNMGVKVRSKNLWPNYIENMTYSNGSTVTVNSDGSITVHKVAGQGISFKETFYFPEGDYVVSNGLDTGSKVYLQASSSTTRTFSSSSFHWGGGMMPLYLYSDSTTELDVTLYPQLEPGTTATSYTPYVEDISAVTLKAQGKNLWTTDAVYPLNGALDYDSETQTYTLTGGVSKSIYRLPKSIPPNTTCSITLEFLSGKISNTVNYGLQVGGYYVGETSTWNGVVSAPVGTEMDLTGTKYTTTFKNTIRAVTDFYVYMSGASVTIHETVKFRVQFEINDTATDWEPHQEADYPATSDGTAQGVQSISPTTMLITDTHGVIIDCEYNKDANMVVNSLLERVSALESAVTNA